jgi:hypothetical protein
VLAALPQPDSVLIPSGHLGRLFGLRLFGFFVFISIAAIGASVNLELFAQLLPIAPFLFVIASYASIHRVCGLSIRKLAPCYAKALLISIISVMPAAAARLMAEGEVPLSGLAVVVVTAPSLWFAALALIRHELINEVRALLRTLKGATTGLAARWRKGH